MQYGNKVAVNEQRSRLRPLRDKEEGAKDIRLKEEEKRAWEHEAGEENESPVNFSILIRGSDERSRCNRSSSGCRRVAHMLAASDLWLTVTVTVPL